MHTLDDFRRAVGNKAEADGQTTDVGIDTRHLSGEM
jgi:hypothetical protein